MPTEFLYVLIVIALWCAAEAEEPLFGMGRRHYLGEGRLDIAYTTELATPHVDWADPYVNGPISAFVIPSVAEGRTLVELMQRLELKVDAVTIDPAWDVNKWTMSFGEAYGARAERSAEGDIDFSFMYKYLEEDLSSDQTWDVMVMHGILGWGHLPESVRSSISQRVREGMGLVIVGPVEGPGGESLSELSPLVPPAGAGAPDAVSPAYRHWQSAKGEWSAQGEHYITRGVPLETFPQDHLGHREYSSATDADVIATAAGNPTIAVRQVGKGRLIALGYENYGLAPFIRWSAYGNVGDAWWETWFSLFIRSIVWAAGKEPVACIERFALSSNEVDTTCDTFVSAEARVVGEGDELFWQVRDDSGEIKLTGRAAIANSSATFPIAADELDGGRHLVDVFLMSGGKRADWATAALTLRSPVAIASLTADPVVVQEGEPVSAAAEMTGPLPEDASLMLELMDSYDRVIARAEARAPSSDGSEVSAELTTGDLLTHIGWVRASLVEDGRVLDRRQVRVDFATPERLRVWDDYEVNVPFYGPQNYYPWLSLIDEQYRRAGVTWLMEPERNFRFTVLAQPGGLGVYHYDRKPFDEQMAAYWRTGDKQYLIRQPCLHRDWRETARKQIAEKIRPYLKYRPFHYYTYDEPSLTSYSRAFDLCFSSETIAAFREWLKTVYGSLDSLNEEWDSAYHDWAEIEPVTTAAAQSEGCIAAWADFRQFMDITYADALKYTQQVVAELDPGAQTLIGGTQVPTPFNGTDWWLFSQSIGILEPYFGIDEFRSFNPEVPIIQACGYQDAGPGLREELWRRALRGQKGATIFWNYTFHDPDLQLNSQGIAMEEAFGVLRGQGVALLLLGAWRDDTRIAILYSKPSMRAAWITDGDIRSGKSERARYHSDSHLAWQYALRVLGFQFHYLSYAQLAVEGVNRERFDALVLPDAIALGDEELENIKGFIADGGTVVVSGELAQCDEHCKPRSASGLPVSARLNVLDIAQDTPEKMAAHLAERARPILHAAGLRPPVSVAEPVGQIVRYRDGECDYIGVIDGPDKAYRITLDCTAHIYDLRERRYVGEAHAVDVRAGANAVGVYALLPSRVDAVQVVLPQELRAGQEVGYKVLASTAPPFRHVFAVQVYGPDGALRHMYGANLNAPSGEGFGRFRLAIDDMPGDWRIIAIDAATGVVGEGTFRVAPPLRL